jgi:hypothetical protein
MMTFDGDVVVFRPESRRETIWILTPQWVTVHNMLDGSTATLSYLAFNTELHKRGYWKGKATP